MTFAFVPRVLTVFLLFFLATKLQEHIESEDGIAVRLEESTISSLAVVLLSLMAASTVAIYFMTRPLPERGLPVDDVNILECCSRCGTAQHSLHLNLDGQIELLGYDLSADQVKPGSVLELTLYWHALTALEHDYTVFTHLLGESYNPVSENFLWGQRDSMPIDGTYPTSRWLANEIVVDRYVIAVQPDAPLGSYHIEVGMYLLETGQRLPMFDDRGEPVSEDRALLEETIQVVLPK